MNKYEVLTVNVNGNELVTIKKIDSDGKEYFIPTDPTNSDYQEYLKSLEA